MKTPPFPPEACVHCESRNTLDLPTTEQPVAALRECHDCGQCYVPAGTPPLHDFHNLLMRTREGIEVVGTLAGFSLHYPPAYGSVYCETDSDCISALFFPDEPSWDAVWAELAIDVGDMLTRYPYTPEPFGTGPSVAATCSFPGCDAPAQIGNLCIPDAEATL